MHNEHLKKVSMLWPKNAPSRNLPRDVHVSSFPHQRKILQTTCSFVELQRAINFQTFKEKHHRQY